MRRHASCPYLPFGARIEPGQSAKVRSGGHSSPGFRCSVGNKGKFSEFRCGCLIWYPEYLGCDRRWGEEEHVAGEGLIDLTAAEDDVLTAYLASLTDLAGDAHTPRLLRETVRGIIGAESLRNARMVAFTPELAATRKGTVPD